MNHSCLRLLRSLLAGCVFAIPTLACASPPAGHPVTVPTYDETLYPPWSHGRNNPATHKGLDFTIPEVDDMPDFHGSVNDPKLVIYVGGNYFFVMAPLVHAFEKTHPDLRGRIFYITIPPGLLAKAMDKGNTFTSGNMTFTVPPDIYAAGLKRVKEEVKAGKLVGPAVPYITNTLTIMVPKGNPGHIHSLADLGNPGVRVVMPNPKWEGVARQIKRTLRKAGGDKLEKAVYDTKVKSGETILTHIHHRQTPLFLMQGLGVAGVTWKSEAIFQEQVGHPLGHIDIPAKYNSTGIYGVAAVKDAPHPQAAKEWIDFLRSQTALKIFERYGFKPVPTDAGSS